MRFGHQYRCDGAKDDSDDSNNKVLTVETIDNHVYFYSEVNSDRCLDLMKQLRDVDGMLRRERLTRSIPHGYPDIPIWLHMHSYGGDLFAAFAVADQIVLFNTPIFSIVEGISASAASIISIACKKRYITPMAHVLIHQFSSFVWGTHEEFRDEMVLQQSLMNKLISFYDTHTRMGRNEITEALKRNTWLSADQCLALGIADELWRG